MMIPALQHWPTQRQFPAWAYAMSNLFNLIAEFKDNASNDTGNIWCQSNLSFQAYKYILVI